MLTKHLKYKIKAKHISQDIDINRQHTIHDPRQVSLQNISLHTNVFFIKSCSFVSFPVCASPWRSVIDVSAVLDMCPRWQSWSSIADFRGALSVVQIAACRRMLVGWQAGAGPFHAAVRLTCRYTCTSF